MPCSRHYRKWCLVFCSHTHVVNRQAIVRSLSLTAILPCLSASRWSQPECFDCNLLLTIRDQRQQFRLSRQVNDRFRLGPVSVTTVSTMSSLRHAMVPRGSWQNYLLGLGVFAVAALGSCLTIPAWQVFCASFKPFHLSFQKNKLHPRRNFGLSLPGLLL